MYKTVLVSTEGDREPAKPKPTIHQASPENASTFEKKKKPAVTGNISTGTFFLFFSQRHPSYHPDTRPAIFGEPSVPSHHPPYLSHLRHILSHPRFFIASALGSGTPPAPLATFSKDSATIDALSTTEHFGYLYTLNPIGPIVLLIL